MKHSGKLSISRWTGTKGTGITIALNDVMSGTECVEISLTAEALGNAITGASFQECEFELRPDVVGMKHEAKTEVVPFNCYGGKEGNRMAEAQEAVKPFEIDGWHARLDDLFNGHRRTKDGNGQSVVFHRYVPAT